VNSEPLSIWGIAIVLIGVTVVPYYMSFRKRHRKAVERRREAEAMGLGKPRAQYPLVNPLLCIGCGACVTACPEGDVLAVIHGTAVVINGERCVGHGLCESACPVGALKVGLGDVRTREDIPIMGEAQESSVPGLFIAGELSGQSLIRNAITQGRAVVEAIARRRGEIRGEFDQDVIIVGAGPAGLSAALTAIEQNLSHVILEEREVGGTILHYPHRKLVMTQPVEIPLYGWLKHDEYSKEALLDIWHEIVSKFPVCVQPGQRVESISHGDDGFTVLTNQGQWRAPFVVLALGRRGTPRKLGVPGEEMEKVMYQLTDACSYKNTDLLVVGGGDSAIEAAVGLAKQEGNRVSISYRKKGFFRVKKKNEDKITAMIQSGAITPLFESEVKEIKESAVLLTTPQGELEIANQYVFIFAGGVPPFPLLKDAGVRFGGDPKEIAPAPRSRETVPAHL